MHNVSLLEQEQMISLDLKEAPAFHAMKPANAFLHVGQMSNLITKLSAHESSPRRLTSLKQFPREF